MKILLFGEYSNVHNTLSRALKSLGHNVFLISDGDGWENYDRDYDLKRISYSKVGSVKYTFDLLKILPKLRGFDVVQIINPVFIKMKIGKNKLLFDYLKTYNKRVFAGVFGSDYYIVKGSIDNSILKYSEYNYNGKRNNDPLLLDQINGWIYSDKKELTKYVMKNCDGIIASLYEYFKIYEHFLPRKVKYIPLPIVTNTDNNKLHKDPTEKINILLGIQKRRESIKGTQVIRPIIEKVAQRNRDKCNLTIVDSVPYNEYLNILEETDILIDQLYSFSPSRNPLIAMNNGIVVESGGEEEYYNFHKEKSLRTIINITPDINQMESIFENMINNKDDIYKRSKDGIEYVNKYHNHIDVANQYLEFWQSLL